jgi:hypothetical protein
MSRWRKGRMRVGSDDDLLSWAKFLSGTRSGLLLLRIAMWTCVWFGKISHSSLGKLAEHFGADDDEECYSSACLCYSLRQWLQTWSARCLLGRDIHRRLD